MGQQASTSHVQPVATGSSSSTRRVVPPFYAPLYDAIKTADPTSSAVATDDVKDVMTKILEFGATLRYLPKEGEVCGALHTPTPEQQLHDILTSADSSSELFQYVSSLATVSAQEHSRQHTSGSLDALTVTVDGRKESPPGVFDARVAAYVKVLQNLYQLTKKEKQRYEQRLAATRTQATSQRKVTPAPLPLPTQNCMTMGWDLVVHLLKATRGANPEHYIRALQMIKDNLLPLKPTTYADSMYLAPSASSSFNALGECLGALAYLAPNQISSENEGDIDAMTIETLAEVALARGSLATLLNVVLWLLKQPANRSVNLGVSLAKIAALKEQPLYGKCEASGELYCCGQNSYGELGIGDDVERHLLTSVSLCGWDDIRQVVSGNEMLAMLTNGGVVLTCGLNKSGQCGHGHFDERVMLLRPVQALRSQRIKFIAASNGCEHMIALTETGLAYSWGYNDRGQLGHENLTTKIHLPKLIESMKDKKLNYAAVSYHHSAVVTDNGELYTFGMNDCGQLGLDHTQHMATPQHVKTLDGHEVSMVACGLYHTIVCTASGELYAMGKNDYGQLGLGHSRSVKIPTPVAMPNEMVCFVACGYYHSVVVTTTGHTYAFGRNDYGQLGIGSKIHQNIPSVVAMSANTRMTRATCGCYHTVLMSEQGQVFVFGRNNKGQLGNRSSADSLLPVPLKVRPEKNSRRCIDAAAGFYTTSLIYERKRENDDGDTVLDQNSLVSVCGRVDIDRSGEIEGLSNFGSVSTVGASLFDGKWFYEVEVVSSGLIQIGWIDSYFQGSSDQGEGVGDHSHSWSYDGNRQRRWNSGSSSYGEKWKAGDVIGCYLDLDAYEMSFYRNGISLGVAFTDLKCSTSDRRSGLMPGISLERGEIIRVNLGHQPFVHPPTNVGEFDAVAKAITQPATAAMIKSIVKDASEFGPRALQGSATVHIKNKIFVIGGSVVVDGRTISAEASNQVWVFYLDNKRWERWSDLPIGIRYHQAVAIDEEHILVIGGENGTLTSRHMDLYKCATSKSADGTIPVWKLVQGAVGAATSLPAPRAHHLAAAIRVRLDTMVFMYGGKSAENEMLGDVWFLSLDDFAWSRLPNSLSLDPGPRSGGAAAVIGECVYMFGGQDKEEKIRADLWRYNTFDRVWHLCFDDNIAGAHDSALDLVNGSTDTSRSEFSPLMPESRVNYSMCADFGHIWVLGGTNKTGAMLNDLWCYSTTSQKWSTLDLTTDDGVEGLSSAACVVIQGAATALSLATEYSQVGSRTGQMFVLGGDVKQSGAITATNRVCEIVAVDSTRTYAADPAKSISMAGKSSLILGSLRSKCAAGSSKTTQQCATEALDSGVCVLSHLDRLAGNEIPGEDTESIQLSRCTYRALCVDPKERTFSALHELLQTLCIRLQELPKFDNDEAQGDTLMSVLYPLLVTIRLLKLNFFELSRCCVDVTEVGLGPPSIEKGGVLHSIRELLFKLAEHKATGSPAGEIGWYYRAVKHETAAAIYHGFSTLFPSLLDRLEVMNKLMKDTANTTSNNDTANAAPTRKLLIPMLVPCFTSPKILFQLMNEAPVIFTSPELASRAALVATEFASTLLDSLWMQTKTFMDSVEIDDGSLIKKLGDIDFTSEFKCVNVLLRACVYWCSYSTQHGWVIIESMTSKIVMYFDQLLARAANLLPNQIQLLPNVIQYTFPGKLLSFALISVGSLPSVRTQFAVLFKSFWPKLEQLLQRIDSILVAIDTNVPTTGSRSPKKHPITQQAGVLHSGAPVRISDELGGLLGLQTCAEILHSDVLKALWAKIAYSDSFRAKKLGKPIQDMTLFRVFIPTDLAKLFCTVSLIVAVPHTDARDATSLRRATITTLSFGPSRTILSQHIWSNDGCPSVAMSTESSTFPPPALTVMVKTGPVGSSTVVTSSAIEESVAWLKDVQKILTWLGSHFAAALVTGKEAAVDAILDGRWKSSPLFRGGLQDELQVSSTSRLNDFTDLDTRNDLLLQQIISNVGAGKKLVDKIKHVLDPASVPSSGGANPKLLAARLKRQDSVEAALEKSGGIEVVDKTVRVTFAVLLKHSNASYVNDALTKDGTASEAVVDTWRSALQIRRWVVREQQKLASEKGMDTSEISLKDRQQMLYGAVCEPVIRRGQLLLQLRPMPAVKSGVPLSPFKLLPGISVAPVYDLSLKVATEAITEGTTSTPNEESARQLNKLMETKSLEKIEEEDERVQSDIFAFLQQSSKPKLAGAVDTEETPDLVDTVLAVLHAHHQRGKDRLDGLSTFFRLLALTSTNPSCRLHIIPALSAAFKRIARDKSENLEAMTIEKVHFLEDLQFSGPAISSRISREFFRLVESLLRVAQEHLTNVRTLVDSAGGSVLKPLSMTAQKEIHEVMLVFEACSIPYQADDWDQLNQIKFISLLTELTTWRSWKAMMHLDFTDYSITDLTRGEEYPIIPVGISQRCPKIICPRSIAIGTDLHQLTITHCTSGPSISSPGGLAVFDHEILRGRWYWEVSIVSQSGRHPIFVGVSSGVEDLNNLSPSLPGGFYLYTDRSNADTALLRSGLRCRVGDTIGVLLDCEEKKLEIYIDTARLGVMMLRTPEIPAMLGFYAAIGICDAEVYWNLTPSVPEKLWASSIGFQLPSAVISGCLVAAPFNGTTISWDAKARGRQLRLTTDGSTVIAGDCSATEDQFETIIANQNFDAESIYAEVHVLSPGRDGRCSLSFGIVGSNFNVSDGLLKDSVNVACQWPEDNSEWSIFGVLFDFASGMITIYPNSSEPLSGTIELATSMKRPMFPAVSALCNGVIFAVNFHPQLRPELPSNVIRPAACSDNMQVTSSNDAPIGKQLQMQVLSCDGGEFSSSHVARNCLVDDATVFSSAKSSNVNIVLRHEVDTPFSLSHISVRGPGPGYSSPLRHAIVFVTSTVPDLHRFEDFDSLTPEQFAALPFCVPSPRSDRDEALPVAYFVLDGSCAQIAKQLAVPVTGRYVLVKLLCPSAGSNIDVGYLGFCGTMDTENGPAYAEECIASASCEECRITPLYGVHYFQKDDESIRICASCYDDNRGRVDVPYLAHTSVGDLASRADESSTVLCMLRKPWLDKLSSQMGFARRPKALMASESTGTSTNLNGRVLGKSERSFTWYDDCELFSCGQNNYGELCLGHCNSTSKLEHVPFFSGKSTRDIAGGNEVLAVLMKDGTLFTCGLNKSGQCGNGTFEERVLVATPVRALAGIVIDMIAAANGCEHMLAVSSDGAVYSWGYNDRGQLGLGSTISKSHTPRLIESLHEKYVITYAAVSYHHSGVVASTGELFTFGMNDCGQLGLDHMHHQHTPQLVEALSSQVITKVACGLYHTVCITANGELYAFGKNDYGQLGLGHARNVKVPTLVRVTIGESEEKIVDVSCGYYHTVVITDKGKLSTWGRNDYGQLGIGSKDHKNSPQYVPLPLSSRIRKSSCGCYHTLILLANGRVMVFGRNNKGQLGAGARTLPSADLPLPIPSNSLSNDEVVCIAAGFYSSYIVTGRSSSEHESDKHREDAAQAKDLPEHTSSEALYESLMKEIDRHRCVDSTTKPAAIQIKRSNVYGKLPLLKLYAAAWAMTRALLYSLLHVVPSNESALAAVPSKKRSVVLRSLVDFLLGNLKQMQSEMGKDTSRTLQVVGNKLDSSISLRNACIGLLVYCGSKVQLSGIPEPILNALYPHFFKNQVLWVLLSCGSVNTEVGGIIASNAEVLAEILRGITSSDLTSATICIRLAMLVFPLHSVASVNAAYRGVQAVGNCSISVSSDIISKLMLMVGTPLTVRPRLCSHELGVERTCSALCEMAQCVKGLTPADDSSISHKQGEVLEQSHIASAKSAEIVVLLRYLTLYPTWKVAVNASISRAFTKTEKFGDVLDTVCSYYTSIQYANDSESAPMVVDAVQMNDVHGSIRTPESTTPEVDESKSEGEKHAESNVDAAQRDKKALQVWQKAKDALDALASMLAAISVVGGHIEHLREGALVVIEDPDHKCRGKSGVLSGIKKDARGEIVASLTLVERDQCVWSPLQQGTTVTANIPVKHLRTVERVPSLLSMFDGLDGIISSLSVFVLPSLDECALHAELEQPQNNSVQVVLGRRMRAHKKQIQWRATKALSSLLKQMPSLNNSLINADTQLLSNIAQTIASEDTVKNINTLAAKKIEGSQALTGSILLDSLHSRWMSVKQRQTALDTERVMDASIDNIESATREQVVCKLGQENALSWGLDAIQSPRKNVSAAYFMNGTSGTNKSGSGQNGSGVDAQGGVFTSDLPNGAWGVLHPLPQLNENENAANPAPAMDFTPFHLTTPIVRVGRAADSCDLIVNDRSVSGRHFHLRRVRRDTDAGEDHFELQDFSKNGTIVNGVRVHGTSVRVTPGSRISLILSRGGLVTYEFQVRSSSLLSNLNSHSGGGGMSRIAPPPIITGAQQPSHGEPQMMGVASGQEYQQPQGGILPPAIEPRSPAEIQNRGSRQLPTGMEAIRARMPAGQGLRLITSIAESEVPRALISPNPAVESPRVGGFSSPRSSILQAPGTPLVATPIGGMFGSMIPSGVLSPASFQQRESSATGDIVATRPADNVTSEALRIALGRDSVNRETGQRNSLGASPEVLRLKTFSELNDAIPAETDSIAVLLSARMHEAGLHATLEQCHVALRMAGGDTEGALTILHEELSSEMIASRADAKSPNVQHLATLLGKSPVVCSEALRQSQNNVAAAMRLLLSSAGAELESAISNSMAKYKSGFIARMSGDEPINDVDGVACADSLMNLQEIMEENPSYKLTESSAQQQALRARPSSPTKGRSTDAHAATKSQIALWIECLGGYDDRLLSMSSPEVDEEEVVLCDVLTAVHSRKLLHQIVRLFSDVPDQADNLLAAFGDPVTLRHLILFPEQSPSDANAKPTTNDGPEDDGKVQRILSRLSQSCFSASTTTTMQVNLSTVQSLSTLASSIDQCEQWTTKASGLPKLLRALLAYEGQAMRDDDSGLLQHTNIIYNLVVDALLHILSRTYVHHGSLLNWEAAMSKARRPEIAFPKGPIRLSCGMECVVVTTYERVWSVPSPDPLLQYRHKWRQRARARNGGGATSGALDGKSSVESFVTLWRPSMPSGVKVTATHWFTLGDVMNVGGDAPDTPVLLVHDDGTGLLAPPVGFERVDVTGKGLPKNSDNDPDFQRKQLRSLWWPIAPAGFVALGCVAGNKEEPFEQPDVKSVRCVREDLVQRVESYSCAWRAETRTFAASTTMDSVRDQQTESRFGLNHAPSSEEGWVCTSLWSIDSDYTAGILPVISVEGSKSALYARPSEVVTAFTVKMSLEDKILCSPVTLSNVMSFVNTLLQCQKFVKDHPPQLLSGTAIIRSEVAAALFALIQQVLKEKLPGSGVTAVRLVRSLISLIQNGARWNDKRGFLYCRSKIMMLQQDQDGGLMLNSLLQAFVELLLVVEEKSRTDRVGELASCLDKKDAKSTIHLPYQFHFACDSHKEMLVSHSSKMAVTRHFSGEERKFLLEYHNEDVPPPPSVGSEVPVATDSVSCRFEHTPELVVTMKEELKAEIVYFEVTIMEWTNASGTSLLNFGFSTPEFPLEGPAVGLNVSSAKTYSIAPVTDKVHTSDMNADQWRWNEVLAPVAIGDIYGCGLRVDTQEVFFTKNGQMLGTAFSSVNATRHQHPTISVSGDCKLLINFGCSGSGVDMYASKVTFAFRFNAMDYDNVMSGFEWYEQLSQVYGVMKSLMDPAREAVPSIASTAGALPDEFMLSADNFLSEISKDVCIRVESAHPYDLELQEALVSIPLATSIRVKLDAQCETANSHCLQILQGGDGAESSSSESEVRAFTGACGGQEVMIEGDSFVWRFPVQSNFQCRVDRVRKGPYLKLENRDTRLSLTRDKGWQTAIGVARFDSGVHIWEVRITFVTASSNIFLGLARRDVRLDSYLGKDNRGWGWIGNRALWHNGSKQRGTYGEKFKTGDIVRMTLDLKRGTLSYAINGKDLGVAFGPGGVGPKLEGTFYPGFALYNQRDSLDLIGGHRVEDGESVLVSSGGITADVGEDLYCSEDEEEGGIGEIDDGIPNFRMELATALSQMGFPMDWCVYALKHCEDDAEQAADFILGNMHVMEALVREDAEAQSRRQRHREAHAAAAAAVALGTISGSVADVGSPLIGDLAEDMEHSVSTSSAEDSFTNADASSGVQNVEKWGIAFTAVPEFSVTGRRLLAAKYGAKLRQLHESQAVFTPELDNAIVQIVNKICEARAEALLSCDPLRMAPEDFVPSEEHIRRFQCLDGIPLDQVQKRFLILRNFNCRLQNSLSFIDFSIDDEHSLLARGTRLLRGIIFQHVKLAWWLNILKEQQSPAAARPEIEVDRHRAREATEVTGVKESVFAQCFDQLHSIQPSLLRGADRAFKCQFVGEFGDDFGGLYRECLAQISSELQSKVLPIIKPCPNAINMVGENREQYVPNTHLRNDTRLVNMAEFLGKLIGIAIRTKTPLDLNLPAVFWKMLVAQAVTRRDVESIHQGCFQVVDTIDNIAKHGITETMFDEIIDATFTVLSSAKQEVELVPSGRHVRVLWEDKEAYARAVETYRLSAFAPVCDDILRGIATILPVPTIAVFTWKEFATLVCGKPAVDIDLLRRRTIYGDGCQASDPHIAFFWEVLNEFTDEQKSSFLRFVWGRSRLPTHAADFTQDFKISGLPKAAGRPDMYLPIAHTCFFSIDLPNYTSCDVMRDKLLYAITHCQSIDADNTTIAQRAGQGLNWTAAATATATSTAVATAAAAVSSVLAGLAASISESS